MLLANLDHSPGLTGLTKTIFLRRMNMRNHSTVQLKKRLLLLALFALMVFGPLACHRARPLYDPQPIQVSRQMSQRDVGNMIEKTLRDRGWSVRRMGNGKMQAQIFRSQHSATIEVAYNSRNIDINYLDSGALNYQMADDGPRIHSRYNNWVQHIENDLRSKVF